MIFVKETRPSIVLEYPSLGALDIMKKVGQLWQRLLIKENGTKYFQDKADRDKLRYLNEQRAFYDEVEKIYNNQDGGKVERLQAQFEDKQSDIIGVKRPIS